MDAINIPSQLYRKVKPQGKVRRRLQDLRISSCFDFWANRAPLDLSHNEGARVAADCLLSQGREGYDTALKTEGEVDFLSEQEKNYFLDNGKESHSSNSESDADAGDGSVMEFDSLSSSSQSATPRPSVSRDSDATEAVFDENGFTESKESTVEAYFCTEKTAAGLKDVVREFIRKAKKSLAIVTDSFSDVELLCDLLEASKKRFVSVHLLLDHLNLKIFRDMWQELKLQSKDFPKFSVHSVEGQTFCAKTGRKLNGQISETFIITDWMEALTGSFSLSWLSWLVHRNMAFQVKGSAAAHFLQEFERLSSCSAPVPGFIHVPFTPLIETSSHTKTDEPKGKVASSQTDMVRISDWIEDGIKSRTIERTQPSTVIPQFSRPFRQPVMQHVCMEKFMKPSLGGIQVHDKGNVLQQPHTLRKSQYHHLVPHSHSQQNGVNQVTARQNVAVTKGTVLSNCALLNYRQDKTAGLTQNKDFNQDHHNVVHEDYRNPRQNRTIMTPPGIAAGINKLREERSTSKIKSNPTNGSNVTHCIRSPEKCEKQCGLFPINGSQGATYGLSTAVKSNGNKTMSPRHHFLQSQTMRSPSTSMTVQPNHEAKFSPAAGNTSEEKIPQQVTHTSRLSWMTQNNVRPGHMTRPVSFYSYDTIQNMDGQRKLHNALAKPLARSKSMTERPATHLNFR